MSGQAGTVRIALWREEPKGWVFEEVEAVIFGRFAVTACRGHQRCSRQEFSVTHVGSGMAAIVGVRRDRAETAALELDALGEVWEGTDPEAVLARVKEAGLYPRCHEIQIAARG